MSVCCGAAHRPCHKTGDAAVVSQIAPGLQALLAVTPVELERWSLQPCPGEGPGVPKHPHGLQQLVATSVPLCRVPRDGAWCLLTSPAQQSGLPPPKPLLPQGLVPRRDLGWLVGAISPRRWFSGVCPQAPWQDGIALADAAPLPPDGR